VDVSTLPQAPGRLPPLCGRCGYSFQGLTEIRACPECGQPVTARSRAAAFTDNIASAGSGFLLLIAAGLYMCALSAVALTVLVFYDPLDPATSAAVRTLLAVVWAAGCWVMTWPRPVRPGFEDPADKEWRGLRLATRWTQPLWPLAYGMAYLAVSSANAGLVTVASVSHLVLLALAGISIAFPAGYGMGLADWAGDSGLRERLRWVVWAAFCIPAYLGVVTVVAAVFPNGIGPLAMLSVIPVMVVVAVIALLFVVGMGQLARNATWAISNAAAAKARDERVAEKLRERWAETVRAQESAKQISDEAFEVEFFERVAEQEPEGADESTVRRGNYVARRDDVEAYDLAPDDEPDRG